MHFFFAQECLRSITTNQLCVPGCLYFEFSCYHQPCSATARIRLNGTVICPPPVKFNFIITDTSGLRVEYNVTFTFNIIIKQTSLLSLSPSSSPYTYLVPQYRISTGYHIYYGYVSRRIFLLNLLLTQTYAVHQVNTV